VIRLKMKLVLIGVTVISVIFLSQKVTSFSEAVVKSDTSIKITNQENALISVSTDKKVKVIPGETSEITINLSNRVSNMIDLKGATATLDRITYSYESKSFKSGESVPLQIQVEADDLTDKQGQQKTLQIPLQFKWETGEATIPVEIKVDIKKKGSKDDEKHK
jgi:ABC-type microcin C transport system permease subunit YejE